MIACALFTCLVFPSQGERESSFNPDRSKIRVECDGAHKNWDHLQSSFRLFQALSGTVKALAKCCTKRLAAWPLPSNFAR